MFLLLCIHVINLSFLDFVPLRYASLAIDISVSVCTYIYIWGRGHRFDLYEYSLQAFCIAIVLQNKYPGLAHCINMSTLKYIYVYIRRVLS